MERDDLPLQLIPRGTEFLADILFTLTPAPHS
jgi:hypothetical protein